MGEKDSDINPDIHTAVDRGESTGLMEPLLMSEGSRHRPALTEFALELASQSAAFSASLPQGVLKALADLVRAMNCYYSNLIEGHDTHPIDIERALKNDYSADPRKRDLQLEARAYIAVQKWIDEKGLKARPTASASIIEIHKRFCENLPQDLLVVEDSQRGERVRVVPGELRRRDVRVGRHVPVSPGAVPRFLRRFEEGYGMLGRAETVLATAAAHHRLLWIHPFVDGNGRVARLVTHAMLLECLETGAVWSVARGLARREAEYKQHLAQCDLPRRNDLDGRGTLSEEALAEFARFFLEVCTDQVAFMRDLVEPNKLRGRILQWVEGEVGSGSLPAKAGSVLEAMLYRGELARADVANVLGTTDRHARRITSALLDSDVLRSDGPRGALSLNFPARLASSWMPGLFPDKL